MQRFAILIFFLMPSFLFSQLELQVYDRSNKLPVADAFAFIDRTDINTISNKDGLFTLPRTFSKTASITVSHLNYQIYQRSLQYVKDGDTLWLQPTQHDLSEVEVLAKASNKRKKWLKRFQRDILGVDAKRFDVQIMNPESITFQEERGTLQATASAPLTIENRSLGYSINYWLENYRSQSDGSIHYQGKYFFEEISNSDVSVKRNEVYAYSLTHFLRSLINGDLRKYYQVNMQRSVGEGALEFIRPFDQRHDLTYHEKSNSYEIQLPDILEIVHLQIASRGPANRNRSDLTGLGRPAEQDMIQQEKKDLKRSSENEKSYLFSRSGKIVFDAQGRVLNSEQIKEYGFWATLGLASSLPLSFNGGAASSSPQDREQSGPNLLTIFYGLISSNEEQKQTSLDFISKSWKPEFAAPLIELLRLSSDPHTVDQIATILAKQTGQQLGSDFFNWMQWLWKTPENIPSFYADLKAALYQHIDPLFKGYFEGRQSTAKIRLDEILWGGVKQDGIPPLRMPSMIGPSEATYLADDDVVFGIYLNGEAKAYPKRILAWHEFFVDKFGDRHIAGVYCTLCGTVIAYDMTHGDTFHDLGTSGFLYRSNKLMYDQATQSLWNTIEGKPVLGPLADKNINLKPYWVVTTTWSQWRTKHPKTKVLSLATGHRRNYDEGAAYRDYFATDRLMFPVPKSDLRLKNKDEVLVIRSEGYQNDPLAISIKYLVRKGILQEKIADTPILILTEKNGSSRCYFSGDVQFSTYDQGQLVDHTGRKWEVTETAISLPDGTEFERIPAHRIFWFAWFNAYPQTRLIK